MPSAERSRVLHARVPGAARAPDPGVAPRLPRPRQGRAQEPAPRASPSSSADYRAYGVGDDLRYVDWNAYARLDRLHVKLFVDEEDLCLHLLVDASASMDFGRPTKLDYAARLAAALGFVGLVGLERVGVGMLRERVSRGLAAGARPQPVPRAARLPHRRQARGADAPQRRAGRVRAARARVRASRSSSRTCSIPPASRPACARSWSGGSTSTSSTSWIPRR